MTIQPSLKKRASGKLVPYLFIAPAFFLFAIFVLTPVLATLCLSFFEWSGFSTARFIGIANYRNLLADKVFWLALQNNFKFIVFYTVLPILLGLLLTMLMGRRNIWGRSFFRVGTFVSYVMPMAVVGVVWRWMYNPIFGPINTFLRSVGLQRLALGWLGDFQWAFAAVGLIATWAFYPYCTNLFLSGVQRVDESLYDAAKVDGANDWQQFIHVTIPGIRPEIVIATVTTFIFALRAFDLVFVTTRGGPAHQTLVSSLYLYFNAFQINRVGYAAAVAVVQTAVLFVFSSLLLSRYKGREDNK